MSSSFTGETYSGSLAQTRMAKTLNPKSEPSAASSQAVNEGFSLVSSEKLLAIYTTMVKCRMLEQHAAALFQQGKLTSDLHASAAREASAAAATVDLLPEDTLLIPAGDWLPAFVKGFSLERIFRILASAGSSPDNLADLELPQKNIFVSSINALHTEIVRERASEALIQKKGAIVVAVISSGHNSLKPWQKTMASAAAKRLPIVFVHYVNEPTPSTATGAKPLSRNSETLMHGVPAIAVDALDPVAVYRVSYEAIIRARHARGASLLECTVHPIQPQPLTIGAQIGKETVQTALPDPVIAMEDYLKRKAIEPEPHSRHIVDSFSRDLDLATRFLDR